MRTRAAPLLCELHSHTTWSDGVLSTSALVDLYGQNGFDVLCVTDHVIRSDDPWLPGRSPGRRHVLPENHRAYLDEILREAERARRLYDLLVIPGLELTDNAFDPLRSAHALALGLHRFVDVDDGLEAALGEAREHGATIVGAHPYRDRPGPSPGRTTQRFAHEWRRFTHLVDRYELFNRTDLFSWVAEAGLPGVATGDFHRPEHLPGWKTLIPCAKDEASVVSYLRSPLPVYLTQLSVSAPERLAA